MSWSVGSTTQYTPGNPQASPRDTYTETGLRAVRYGVRDASYFAGDRLASRLTSSGASLQYPSYGSLFALGNQQVPVTEFKPRVFSDAVKNNLNGVKENIRSGRLLSQHYSPAGFAKTAFGEGNFGAIRDAAKGKDGALYGTAAVRSLLYGLVGYDIFKNTKRTYDVLSANEDGSDASRQETLKGTGKALLNYTARGAVTWEAGSLGAAVGAAVLPFSLGPISLGAVAVGAVFAVAAQTVYDKTFSTGVHDDIPRAPEDPPQGEPA